MSCGPPIRRGSMSSGGGGQRKALQQSGRGWDDNIRGRANRIRRKMMGTQRSQICSITYLQGSLILLTGFVLLNFALSDKICSCARTSTRRGSMQWSFKLGLKKKFLGRAVVGQFVPEHILFWMILVLRRQGLTSVTFMYTSLNQNIGEKLIDFNYLGPHNTKAVIQADHVHATLQ